MFAPLPWQQYARKYYLISLPVLFTWVNHLQKFQRNLSSPTFEMKRYLLITFCLTDFFLFFIIGQSIRLSIYVSGHLTEVLLKMITSLYYKNCAANAFSSLRDHWNDMANICLLAQFSRVKQLHTQQCTFEFQTLSISTVLNSCESRKLHASTNAWLK